MTTNGGPPSPLPSFFVLGAQKAGTTSLHRWLSQQPDVCLPLLKETHFFSSHEKYNRGIDWYIKQFPECRAGDIIGEIAPEYMFDREAARRIKKWIPSPKLIFIFRHPIERAYSNYLMSLRTGHEKSSFFKALLEEPGRLKKGGEEARATFSYMARGAYVTQVLRYKEVFPEASFLYVKFDDLIEKGDPGFQTYKRLCLFIGLSSDPALSDRSKAGNPASKPRSLLLRDFLYGSSVLKKTLGRLIRDKDFKERLASRLDGMNQRPISGVSMGKIPGIILDDAKREIERLQRLTSLDLTDWLSRTDRMGEGI